MPDFETLQEGLLARDLYVTQDHFGEGEKNLRVIAKLQVPKGIKQGIWWEDVPEKRTVGEGRIRERVSAFEHVSDRPFVPGDPCDGTRDSCVWGCLWDAARRSEVETQAFVAAVNRAYGSERITGEMRRVTEQQAAWEGTYLPRVWTRKWVRRLMKSVRAINWSTTANMIRNRGPEETRTGATWLDVLTEREEMPELC